MGIGMRGPGEKQLEVDAGWWKSELASCAANWKNHRMPQRARGGRAQRANDGLARRLYQCRQKHADEVP